MVQSTIHRDEDSSIKLQHLVTVIELSIELVTDSCSLYTLSGCTVVRKFFDRKYFIDKKIRGKIFSLVHDFLEICHGLVNIDSG